MACSSCASGSLWTGGNPFADVDLQLESLPREPMGASRVRPS